jgi:hypothetical protein
MTKRITLSVAAELQVPGDKCAWSYIVYRIELKIKCVFSFICYRATLYSTCWFLTNWSTFVCFMTLFLKRKRRWFDQFWSLIIRAKFPLVSLFLPPPQGHPLLLKHLTYGFICRFRLRAFTLVKLQPAHWTDSLVASLLTVRSTADPKNTFGSEVRLVSRGICGEPSAAGATACCHPS